jgi:hypothetical protein
MKSLFIMRADNNIITTTFVVIRYSSTCLLLQQYCCKDSYYYFTTSAAIVSSVVIIMTICLFFLQLSYSFLSNILNLAIIAVSFLKELFLTIIYYYGREIKDYKTLLSNHEIRCKNLRWNTS